MSCAGDNFVVPGANPCNQTPATSINTIDGAITLNSPDGSIVVANNGPSKTISLRPFFDVITGSFLNPTYSWAPAPTSDLTMSASSTTTYTGTWMFFYQASVGPTGWTPLTNCYTRWTAGPQFSQNVRQVDMGVVATTLEHSCAFINEFGTTARPIVVGCILNNIAFTANPSFGGLFYACKLSQ
jgi:hypothetical protein